MKKLFFFVICLFVLFACSVKRTMISEGEVISEIGIFIEIPNVEGYYFISCKEILDSVNIMENVKAKDNLNTGMFLYECKPIADFVLRNENKMVGYLMKNGEKLKALLVSVTYSEISTRNVDMGIEESELPLNETTIHFSFRSNFHKVYAISGLCE